MAFKPPPAPASLPPPCETVRRLVRLNGYPRRLLCDEGVERQIVALLRSEGHDVSYVAEMDPGISDDQVLDVANAEKAVLVTADKDFGDLVFRQGRTHHGVVLVRLHGIEAAEKARLAAAAIADHVDELPGAFSVIEGDRIRIRIGRPR